MPYVCSINIITMEDTATITRDQILDRIYQIKNTDVFLYETANVEINAPLALTQYGLQCELHTLEWVLKIPYTNISLLRNKNKE